MRIKSRIDQFLESGPNEIDFSIQRVIFFTSIFIIYKYIRGVYGVNQFFTEENRVNFSPVSFFVFLDFEIIEKIYFHGIEEVFLTSLILCALGLFFRLSTIVSFFTSLYLFGVSLNFGKVHHSNHLPVVVLFFLMFMKTPGKFSVDNFLRKKLNKFLVFKKFIKPYSFESWPLQLIFLHLSIVYFASGFQKLRASGLDWIFSDNLSVIILTRPSVTPLGILVAENQLITIILAFATVFFELFAPLALLGGRFKFIFMASCCLMHVGAESTMGSHGDFKPYIACFSLLIPWYSLWNQFKIFTTKIRYLS